MASRKAKREGQIFSLPIGVKSEIRPDGRSLIQSLICQNQSASTNTNGNCSMRLRVVGYPIYTPAAREFERLGDGAADVFFFFFAGKAGPSLPTRQAHHSSH